MLDRKRALLIRLRARRASLTYGLREPMWRRIVDGRLANKVRVKNCRKVGKEKHSPGASQEQGGTDCFFRSGRMKRAGAFQVLSLIGNSACNKAFCVFSLVKCLHFSSKWCNYPAVPGERATRRFALSEKSGEGFTSQWKRWECDVSAHPIKVGFRFILRRPCLSGDNKTYKSNVDLKKKKFMHVITTVR